MSSGDSMKRDLSDLQSNLCWKCSWRNHDIGWQICFCIVGRSMRSWHIIHLHQLSSRNRVYYSSEYNSLFLLLSHPSELSKTHRHDSWVTCLLKMPLRSSRLFYRAHALSKRHKLLTLFSGLYNDYSVSHSLSRNVHIGSDEPAGSNVTAAAMLHARSFGSALGSSCSSVKVRHIQPSCSQPPRPRSGIAGLPARGLWSKLTLATSPSRSPVVQTAQEYLCPWWHSQAVLSSYGLDGFTQYAILLIIASMPYYEYFGRIPTFFFNVFIFIFSAHCHVSNQSYLQNHGPWSDVCQQSIFSRSGNCGGFVWFYPLLY